MDICLFGNYINNVFRYSIIILIELLCLFCENLAIFIMINDFYIRIIYVLRLIIDDLYFLF